MNQNKKPRVWNWSDAGTRWSSRVTSRPSSSGNQPRRDASYSNQNSTIPSSTGSVDSRSGPKAEADSDDDDSSSRRRFPSIQNLSFAAINESTESIFEEGIREGSRKDHSPGFLVPGEEELGHLGLEEAKTHLMTNRRSHKSASATPSVSIARESRSHSTPKTSSSLSPAPTDLAPTPVLGLANTKPMVTNIELWNARRKEIDAKSVASKALLQRYLLEMKKTHAYIVKSTLTAARLDLNARSAPRGNGAGRVVGITYDEASPFEDMNGIEVTATEAKDRKLEVGRFSVRCHGKPHSSSEHKLVIPATISVTPKTLAQMPKYHSYTTLKNNILAEDDEVMRYFPYFGEDAEEEEINQLNLEETFVDRTKASAEDGKKNEYAAMYTTFIKDFLAELDLSVAAVTHYLIAGKVRNESVRRESLPEDFDPDDPKVKACRDALEPVSQEELTRAEMACRVFKQQTKISIWEVVKRADQMVKDSINPTRLTTGNTTGGAKDRVGEREKEVKELTGGNPLPYSLESYAALNCLLCFMHECPFHVNKDHDRVAMGQAGDYGYQQTTRKDNTVILRLATNVPGWACTSKGSVKDAWGDDENYCSKGCFLIGDNMGQAISRIWSAAQLELLRSSAAVLKKNTRCACLIASIINKPCAEIYRQLRIENLLAAPLPSGNSLTMGTLEDSEPRQGVKRKKPAVPAIPGYPADCYLTHTHEKRAAFQACRHLGHCTDNCPCVMTHVTCEKSCICSPDCPRRWRGCSCKREGRACTRESCICVKANRECDVDLCHSCGATEALDPMNRYDERYLRDCCQNVWLQRDRPKRTLLGRSAVAGFGLFMGEDVKKDAFLGEYKGEVITSDEADRRGKLYDKRGVSFLFNLNLNQVIDATRAGNKFRYVNHSSKRPNCGAKVYMANCTHRIGMFAKRDLVAGEELFFDYGYNNKQVKFVQKEFEPPEYIPPSAAAGKKKRPSHRRKELEYLKGGKGTTERSRARATAVPAGTTSTTTTSTTTTTTGTTTATASTTPVPATASAPTRDPVSDNNNTNGSRPVVKSAEYVQDTETSDEDVGHEDDGSIAEPEEEEVDEEYEPDTEESLAVEVVEVSSEGEENSDDDGDGDGGDDDDDDEPPRRAGSRGAKRARTTRG